jgi:ribosomal-protein-alanine N-acetyltransferase
MIDLLMTTSRLGLRRMEPDDVPALHAILSDAEAMRYWSTLPHDSLAVTVDWVERSIAAVATGSADEFVVLRDGSVIGKAGFWRGREIGVILTRAVWGRAMPARR